MARGVGVVVEGACLLVVLIGRLGCRGTGLVGMLSRVSAAAKHKLGPTPVQCESQDPPGLLEEDGHACPVVDVEELKIPIGELRGDQVDDEVKCAGKLRVRAGDEAHDLPRVLGVELGLDCPGRAGL